MRTSVLLSSRGTDVALPRPYRLTAQSSRLIALCLMVALVVCLLTGCREGGVASDARLLAIDSIVDTDSVTAWRQLQAIDSASLTTDADRNLYALLHQQLLYKQYLPFDTTVINRLVAYYEPQGGELYARAVLYKGISLDEAGDKAGAVAWLKHAEGLASDGGFTFDLAFSKLRMAKILQAQFTQDSVPLLKYKEAAPLFRATGHYEYECACLTEVGTLYRMKDLDSAWQYLSAAQKIALELGDSTRIYNIRGFMSGYYYMRGDYAKAKDVAVKTLREGAHYMSPNPLSHTWVNASFAYAQLGNRDSALYYIEHKPRADAAQDEMFSCMTLKYLAEKEGNFDEYDRNAERKSEIADSILLNTLQTQLREVEARYDKSQAELNAVSWRNKFLVVTLLAVLLLAMLALIAHRLLTRNRRNRMQIATLQTELQSLSRKVGRHEGLNAELREALLRELAADQEMLLDYYTVGKVPKTYHHKMEERLRSPQFSDTLWQSILTIADSEHDGFVTRLREAFPQLREEDVRFLVLERCDFSREFVKFLLGYDNARSVDTRRARLARRMGLDEPLRKWLKNF